MSAIAYTVAAILPNEQIAQEYLGWLEEGHVDQVIHCGAHSGMIVRVTDPSHPIRVETRYVFPNMAAFEAYLSHHAPALRADGLRRFPPERGVRFERQVGTIL